MGTVRGELGFSPLRSTGICALAQAMWRVVSKPGEIMRYQTWKSTRPLVSYLLFAVLASPLSSAFTQDTPDVPDTENPTGPEQPQIDEPDVPPISEPTMPTVDPSEPEPSEPEPSEPEPSEPTEPTPTEPNTSEPTPSEPTPGEPTTSEPTPTDPTPAEPTEPEPTETDPPVSGPNIPPIDHKDSSLTQATGVPSEPDSENPMHAPAICAEKSTLYKPVEGCLSYTPRFPLWSDNAAKDRYVFLPAGSIRTTNPNRWSFPVGTRLYKTFLDVDKTKLLETRVITKVAEADAYNSWDIKSYVWKDNDSAPTLILHVNDVQKRTDPKYVPLDLSANYQGVRGTPHNVPTAGQCNQCHSMAKSDAVLGFGAIQLSYEADTLLQKIEARGVSSASVRAARIPTSDSTTEEAIGYLHGNCGNCHAPGGNGPYISLIADVAAKTVADEPVMQTAKCSCVSTTIPEGFYSEARTIKADLDVGSPNTSYIFGRMSYRRAPGASPSERTYQMPPVGTNLPDDDKLKLISDWIASLDGECKCASEASE
jgi:hypothetical protein